MSSGNALIPTSKDQPRLFGLNMRYHKDDLILGSVILPLKVAVLRKTGILKIKVESLHQQSCSRTQPEFTFHRQQIHVKDPNAATPISHLNTCSHHSTSSSASISCENCPTSQGPNGQESVRT
jgi:hypothetical protein